MKFKANLADSRISDALARNHGNIPWQTKSLERYAKRAFDLLVASLLILPTLPIMLVVALLVRMTSKGPVLLHQSRVGLNGVPFRMYKFRTMVADLPDGSASGRGEVTDDDLRLTPIGGWLRAWRLDELPQFYHVLSGEMSLVGPRPDLVSNIAFYSPVQMRRFTMPPGCTAWTLTRGAFENDWSARQDINVEYVDKWSFWLDLQILFESAVVILRQKHTSPKTNALPEMRSSISAAAEGKE
jgi:sugar transferase EpsL